MTRDLATVLSERSKPGPGGCQLWIARVTRKGYGDLWWDGRQVHAHRLAYQLYAGPIPDGFHIHHTCEVRACINPDHLTPVSPREHAYLHPENAQRAKTHCANGHEFTAANTYVYTGRKHWTHRMCRACDRDRKRARSHAQRAA